MILNQTARSPVQERTKREREGKNKKQMKTVAKALQERGQGDAWNACFTHRRNINTCSHTHANATQMQSD